MSIGSLAGKGGLGSLGSAGALGIFDDFDFGDFFGGSSPIDAGTEGAGGGDTSGGVDTSPLTPQTGEAPVKTSPGAVPKFDICAPPYVQDPLNPNFCILDSKVNTTCPKGQVYDPVKKGCVSSADYYDFLGGQGTHVDPTKQNCPYGQKLVNGKCVNLAAPTPTGTSTVKPPPKPVVAAPPPAPAKKSMMVPLVVGGLALLAVGGLAYYAKTH